MNLILPRNSPPPKNGGKWRYTRGILCLHQKFPSLYLFYLMYFNCFFWRISTFSNDKKTQGRRFLGGGCFVVGISRFREAYVWKKKGNTNEVLACLGGYEGCWHFSVNALFPCTTIFVPRRGYRSSTVSVLLFFALSFLNVFFYTQTHGGTGSADDPGPGGRCSLRQSLPYTLAPSQSTDRPLHRPLHAHRLDKSTGGLVVCAKTRPALTALWWERCTVWSLVTPL